MAEAAIENTETTNNNKFYCHSCSIEIKPKLPDFTCPECDNGFIEEITEIEADTLIYGTPKAKKVDPDETAPIGAVSSGSTLFANTSNHVIMRETPANTSTPPSLQTSADPATQFAELWGRAFLESFRNHTAERDEGVAWARDRDSDDDEQEGSSRRQHRGFQPHRVSYRRTRPLRNQYLQGLFQYLSDRLEPDLGGVAGGGGPAAAFGGGVHIPINIVPLHGNPEDYAWGANGLDSIITQLLNQLEGSGAPPAQKEKIDSLPVLKITQTQVDNNAQCSVCMEDFKLDEEVLKLPCEHQYHRDCIVTWLKMHGTCPVCRKDLNGDDVTLKEGITQIIDEESSVSDSSSDLT